MKRIIAFIIIIALAAGFAACGAPAEPEKTKDDSQKQWAERVPDPTQEPTPEPTLSAAEEFAQQNGITLPDIEGEIITDTEQIKKTIKEQPYWRSAKDEADFTFIYWFKDDGRYCGYSDSLGESYNIAGKWYFNDNCLCTEPIDGLNPDTVNQSIPVIVKQEQGQSLYMCDEHFCTQYVPASNEEKQTVSSDTTILAKLRHFLCSASWELEGHYDEEGDYSNKSLSRVYTFLADGQIVMREEGKDLAGYYTLNLGHDGFYDLNYLLADGQTFYSPLYVDNSTHISAVFLYPEYMKNASDLYKAVSKRNVSDIVTAQEPIPEYENSGAWSIEVGQTKVTSDMIMAAFNAVDIDVDGVPCKAYQILWLVPFDSDDTPGGMEVVLQDGTTKKLDSMKMLFSYLVVKKDGETLEKPLYAFLDTTGQFEGDKLSESPVMQIKIDD